MEAIWDQLREFLRTLNGICRLLGIIAAVFSLLVLMLIWIDPIEIAKLNVKVRNPPAWNLFLTFAVFALVSSGLLHFGFRNDALGQSITKQQDGSYIVDLGTKTKIRLLFGDIAEWHTKLNTDLVILPANEHFDEECFADGHSSLAAFASKHFERNVVGLGEAVRQKLANLTCTTRQVGENTFACYGVGTTIELQGKTSKICLVGVSSKFPDGVVAATADSVVCSIARCYEHAIANNMTTILFPILGSGKGGMSEHLALGLLVTVLGALLKQGSGTSPKEIRIVKYITQGAPPAESKREMRKSIETVSNACKLVRS